MSEISKENFEDAVKSSEKCVVDFYATWCGPCKAMNPVLESVESNAGLGKIYKIDVDQNRELVEKLGIRSVPTFLFFENGREIDRKTGIISKDLILNHLN